MCARRMSSFIKLSSGHRMPLLGLGTSKATNPVEAEAAFDEALSIGYRHFDTAYNYMTEELVGNVLHRWLESGRVKREDLFIVTKLPPIGMRPDMVSHFMELSLKNLQLDYIDLYLIHSPVGYVYNGDENRWPKLPNGNLMIDKETDLEGIWKSVEKLVDQDLAKCIGISNFAPSQIDRIMKIARIQPANIQVELNVRFQQKKLRETCQKHGISLCAYSPIGAPGRNEAYIQRGNGGKAVPLIEDPAILDLANRYKKKPSQILLRFLTQNNIAAIPKSINPTRLRENFEIFDFELSSSDMKLLESMDQGKAGRQFILSFAGCNEHPEFKLE